MSTRLASLVTKFIMAWYPRWDRLKVSEEVVLYTTQGCSLCDAVLNRLLGDPDFVGLRLSVVDIALDDRLVEAFGADLPVLLYKGRALRSPFAHDEVAEFLLDRAD